jgi:hypothetical protein
MYSRLWKSTGGGEAALASRVVGCITDVRTGQDLCGAELVNSAQVL